MWFGPLARQRRYTECHRSMTNPPNDRETLQQLLANAFAVQESRIDPHSLTAIMQIQRLLASGKLDVDSVMAHIVDSARHVANASGIAVALLKRDRLTYRAGSGTSAPLIGHQVTASLTVSPGTKTNCEILRVENAQTDTRIEADICRQFGANALLIVPIYQDGTLGGVLDIRFHEPHAFDVPEVRAYRLMAEQIEAALFHAAQFEKNQLVPSQIEQNKIDLDRFANSQVEENRPVSQLTSADDVEEIAPLDDAFEPAPDFLMLPENEHSLYARCGALFADIMQLPVFRHAAWLATAAAQRAKSRRRPSRTQLSAEAAGPELPQELLPQEFPQQEMATQKLETQDWSARDWPQEELPAQQFAKQVLPTQPLPPEAIAPQEPLAQTLSPAQEQSEQKSRSQELPAIPPTTAIPATPAWRTRTSAWRENLRSTAQDASTELFSTFKNTAASAALLAQRARNSKWPDRLRARAHDASSQFSSTFKQASLSAARLTQRARNSNWPDRLRAGSRDAASEFSSILKNTVSSVALLTQRARSLRWTNASRDLAMAAAILFAFTTVLAYRSHGPAKPAESSTSTSAAANPPMRILNFPSRRRQPMPRPLRRRFQRRPPPLIPHLRSSECRSGPMKSSTSATTSPFEPFPTDPTPRVRD